VRPRSSYSVSFQRHRGAGRGFRNERRVAPIHLDDDRLQRPGEAVGQIAERDQSVGQPSVETRPFLFGVGGRSEREVRHLQRVALSRRVRALEPRSR
jgi:hypothetical protein